MQTLSLLSLGMSSKQTKGASNLENSLSLWFWLRTVIALTL